MNKRLFAFFLTAILGMALPAYAQGVVEVSQTGVQAIKQTAEVRAVKSVAPVAAQMPDLLYPNLQSQMSLPIQENVKTARIETAAVLDEAINDAHIVGSQTQITPKWIRPLDPSSSAVAKGVFRASAQGTMSSLVFSGFAFKTTYQGKEEIFGVIAQHAMPSSGGYGTLGQTFTARIIHNGKEIDIPAQVVEMTAPSMADIALVKFAPEDEKLLTPLTLAEKEPSLQEPLQLVGFGNAEWAALTETPLLEDSMISLRFPMEGNRWDWPGLCGSPVVNKNNEVVGIFTGVTQKSFTNLPQTTHARKAKAPFAGYATKNSYLQTLVAAYHRAAEGATFPLMLGGEKIVDLEADEFVSVIILKDAAGNILFNRPIKDKFPYSSVMQYLPKARYVELYIDYVWWAGTILREGSGLLESSRHIVYDLEWKEIIAPNAGETDM